MKKKYIILSIITLVLLITFVTSFNYFKPSNNYVEDNVNNQTKIIKGISMNLEQTVGAGDYKTVTQSNWPKEGYKFNSNLSRCENGSELSWDDTNKAVVVSGNLTDKCYVYFDIVPTLSTLCRNSDILASCIKKYGDIGSTVSNIYIHDKNHDETYYAGIDDNSYRYAGPSNEVNNFVCFGTNVSPCPTDNLYRIIGVIDDKVKLIKYDYATSTLLGTDGGYKSSQTPDASYYKGNLTTIDVYSWNTTAFNVWIYDNGVYDNYSRLNKINLNTNFINNIGSTWAEKIATTTWKIGGNTSDKIYNEFPLLVYENEILNPAPGDSESVKKTEYNAKIGLMYVSDYGYAASPGAWELLTMSEYGEDVAVNNNWMYMGFNEWTITRVSELSNAFFVDNGGYVGHGIVTDNLGVRPVFFLDTSVTYVSGDGTQSSPIRIS